MITRLNWLAQVVSMWLLCSSLMVPITLSANNGPNVPTINRSTIFDLVSGPELVEVTLKTDLVRLLENIKTDDYQSAMFSFENERGEPMAFQTKIRSRGRYRRRVCSFPPLMIKFRKEQLVGANIKPHNKLKLVTHCLNGKFAGQENLLKEYLAYKMYNELTDQSLRVQLIRINYVDIKGKLSNLKRYAILIEDTDEMAERLGGEECDCLNPLPNQLDLRLEGIHAMFQYMIGNEDWSLSMNRNMKVVKPLENGKWKIVPYDFDFSGLVNAAYAVPNDQLGITSIQDRLYLGIPIANTELKYLFKYFKNKEADLYQLIIDCTYLSKRGRNEIIAYLDEFYQKIEDLEVREGEKLYEVMSTNTLPLNNAKSRGTSGK